MGLWLYKQYYGGGKGPTLRGADEKEKRCICQDQHRRGYCTEPTCPYRLTSEKGGKMRGALWKWIKRVALRFPKDTTDGS